MLLQIFAKLDEMDANMVVYNPNPKAVRRGRGYKPKQAGDKCCKLLKGKMKKGGPCAKCTATCKSMHQVLLFIFVVCL